MAQTTLKCILSVMVVLGLTTPSMAWQHDVPVPNDKWATIGKQQYQVLSMENFYQYTTSQAGGEFRLIPVNQIPENLKFRIVTPALDQYCLRFGTSLRCHYQTENGLEFFKDCCKGPLTGGNDCHYHPDKVIDIDLTAPWDLRGTTVKDNLGQEYYVLTVLKKPECPNLPGTVNFPSEKIPFGLKLMASPIRRGFVLFRCYIVAGLVMLPALYLVNIKKYWKLASSLT